MRIFKFRVWDKKMKEMNYSGNAANEDGDIQISVGFFFSAYCEKMDGSWCPTVEIMQFTGLKDKFGKDIYEGDILDWKEHKEILQVDYKYAGFRLINYNTTIPLDAVCANCEVIGNIYENPKLLNTNNQTRRK